MKLSRIRPRYFALFATIMALWMMILYWRETEQNKRVIQEIYSDDKYIQKEIAAKVALTANAKYMKYTSFYNRIINTYSEKSQSKKGMTKQQKADFVINAYRYETWLGLPHFYFISIAKMESSFNPNAEGKLGEQGIFNIMPTTSVIGTAFMALQLLRIQSPWLAQKLEFDFNIIYFDKKRKKYKISTNLKDPLNALKIKALCAWYYKKKYRGEKIWWISADHWGESRIYHLWKAGVPPAEEFRFNVGTVKEVARNPLTYYFWWEAHWLAFSEFNLDVNIDKGWVDGYLKECSKLEAEFVEHWRDIKQLKEMEKEITEKIIILNKEIKSVVKLKLKHKKKIIKLDKEYMKFYKLMKAGKYKNIVKEIFLPMRIYYNSVIEEITKEENKAMDKILAIINISFAILIIVLAMFQVLNLIKKLFRRIFCGKKRCAGNDISLP